MAKDGGGAGGGGDRESSGKAKGMSICLRVSGLLPPVSGAHLHSPEGYPPPSFMKEALCMG